MPIFEFKKKKSSGVQAAAPPGVKKLTGYPAIAVQYTNTETPYFELGVIDALDKIYQLSTGRLLLEQLHLATPEFQSNFPDEINIIVVPAGDRTYVQSGYKREWVQGGGMTRTLAPAADAARNRPGQDFWFGGDGSCNAGENPTKAEPPHAGTVCKMIFNSSQMLTSQGEHTKPFIVLAHELIHSYHCLNGIKHPDAEEEKTTGLGAWRTSERITENQIRAEAGLAERLRY